MARSILLLLLAFVLLTTVLADCGCGATCAGYSEPSRCTRCCSRNVKRSLPRGFLYGPAGDVTVLESIDIQDDVNENINNNAPLWLQRTPASRRRSSLRNPNDRPFLDVLTEILKEMKANIIEEVQMVRRPM